MVDSLLDILAKGRGLSFHKTISIHSVTYTVDESISSTNKWNILNQLGKHEFSCS